MSAIARVVDTITGKSLKKALAENGKTALDLKDEVARARAAIDKARNEEEAAASGRK